MLGTLVLEAITIDLIVGFSNCQLFWKLDIHIFPRTPKSAQSKSKKAFKYAYEFELKKARIANINKVAGGPTRCVGS